MRGNDEIRITNDELFMKRPSNIFPEAVGSSDGQISAPALTPARNIRYK
jgi:hypothetical protein